MNSTTNNDASKEAASPAEKHNSRFKKRWIVWAALFILLGPYIYFRATSFSRKIISRTNAFAVQPQQFNGKLRIATWNIAHGRGATDDNWEEGGDAKRKRIEKIAKLIADFDADIVVLNEVDFSATWSGGLDQATTIANLSGYQYFVKQSNLDFGLVYGRWNFGNVVLSRYPIAKADVVALTPVNGWEDWVVGSKRGISCTIELAPDNLVSLIGVHMEARGETVRVAQAYDITMQAKRAEHPIFIAGDLNTTPSFAPRSNVDKDGKNAFQELVQPAATGLSYSPSVAPTEEQMTFPSGQPNSVIDWILYEDSKYQLVSQTVIESRLSDHLPVVAEFHRAKKP